MAEGLHLEPLDIDCPYCQAAVTQPCVTSRGETAITCHSARARAALDVALRQRWAQT